MSEEQEIKKKPKTTLIKHKKTEPVPEKPEVKPEKKKVVVVKKRVVVVKKAQPKTAAKIIKPDEKPVKHDIKQAAEEQKKPAEVQAKTDGAPVPEETKPKEKTVAKTNKLPMEHPSRRNARSGRGGPPLRPENREGPRSYPPQTQSPQSRPPAGNRGEGFRPRPPQAGKPGESRFRPDARRGPSPQSGPPRRPSAGKFGGGQKYQPNQTKPAAEKKTGNKKFFKAKKKDSYQKKEKHLEKEIRIKKKSIQMINPVPKQIDIMEVITVSELAKKMNLKASELISKLIGKGMMVTINQQIDAETVSVLAAEYDCKVNIVSLYDETIIETEKDSEEELEPRPPIVTIMGHVDHGKTKLLDAIRTTDVVGGEFGGITQHIGAYTIDLPTGKLTFLDTPGHEAFTLMRARGAQVTDIVILVVAANDGVMPQTVEAVNHAKEANVPIIVAVNKIDLPEANVDRVKQQLSEYNLIPEDWGGNTLYNEISALKNQGIEQLLETILLQSELLELKANRKCNAEGKVIESKIDHGRGIVSTVLIERGTLKVGDTFVAGIFPGRVRAMFNDKGEKVTEAIPSMPVEILGFTGIPNAGDPFQVTENEKFARQVGVKRQELKKLEGAKNVKKITLDNLYDSIQEGEVQELKVVIKGDVHGSVEALQSTLEKLSTDEIRLSVIHASAGAINEKDVMLASASTAIIIGFHVRPTSKAQQAAEREKVEIRKYNIIYDVVDEIKLAMEGLLAPELKEETIGLVEVRDIFKVPKIGVIAGCHVTSGKVTRGAEVHIIRDGVQILSGKINSLKRFKDDAKEVEAGFECGIGVENFNDIQVGDQFEVFQIKEIAKKLEAMKKDA
jgi:translation initiation factor IF-2